MVVHKYLMKKLFSLFNNYKTSIIYTGGALTKALAQLIVGFVIAKYISPDDFGLWATINLALSYCIFFQAGFINGLNLELPLVLGKGDEKQATLMAGTVQTTVLLSCILIFIFTILYFIFFSKTELKEQYGIITIAVIIIFTFYQNYLMSTFRSKNSFDILGKIQFIDAFVNLTTIIFVVYYSYYGMLIKALVVIVIYVVLLHIYRPMKVGLLWDINSLKKILAVGLPIFVLVLIDSFSSTIDKVWLIKYTNLNQVGIYTFAFYAYSTFLLFSASIANYIYPKMSYNYGKNQDKQQLWKFVKKVTLLLLVIQIPIATIGVFLIPLLINTFFTNYIGSIFIMQILLFAGVLRGSVVGANALYSMKKWKYMYTYHIFYAVTLVVLTYLGAKYAVDIAIGVASGVLIANFLNLFFGLYLTFRSTMLTTKKQAL